MQTYPHGEMVVVLDCVDLDLVADFWTRALGYRRVGRIHEPYLGLRPESGAGLELLLQRVPERKSGKNRLHLDLRTPDMEAEVERLRLAGAAVLTTTAHEEGGWRWHVLADPEGNEFCVLQPPRERWGDNA